MEAIMTGKIDWRELSMLAFLITMVSALALVFIR
jgi:hypothetical protein